MKKKIITIISFIGIIIIVGCSPKKVSMEGDVFLTMQNGTIRPIAATEIYLFPIETDFDSSFVVPLQKYINAAKFNVGKIEVKTLCESTNESIPSLFEESKSYINDYYKNDTFINDLDETCNNFLTQINGIKSDINSLKNNAENEAKPIKDLINEKENEIKSLDDQLNKLALAQGGILKNKQASMVNLAAYYSGPSYVSEYSEPDDRDITYSIQNNSDYIIKSVTLGSYLWKNEVVDYESAITEYYSDSSYLSKSKTISAPGTKNEYGETLPGLNKGQSMTDSYDRIRLYSAWPNDRWIEENLKDLSVVNHTITETGYCEQSRYSPCASYYLFSIDLGFRDIIEIEFGEPYEITRDASNASRVYSTKDVDWIEKGKQSDAYLSSDMHNKKKVKETEIENLRVKVAEIYNKFKVNDKEFELASLENDSLNCESAKDLRDTKYEVNECLLLIDNKEGMLELIDTSKSSLGESISEIFSSISDEDLGYENFEELLNSFAKSRNSFVTVSSIQGAYIFNDIPSGNYVIFTSYEDRFNGVGHWFEEINVKEDGTFDLNNINYKRSGIYSYLRDKIEN